METKIDHVIWAGPSLDDAVAEFTKLSGVSPAFDGDHHEKGFRNALAALGSQLGYGVYLAIDGALPDQTGNYGAYLSTLRVPTMHRFAVQTSDIREVQKILSSRGIETKQKRGSRRHSSGRLTEWTYLEFPLAPTRWSVDMPVFKQWDEDLHPSDDAPGGCTLLSFTVHHPEADRVRAFFKEINLLVPVEQGDRKITARMRGQFGEFDLPSGQA